MSTIAEKAEALVAQIKAEGGHGYAVHGMADALHEALRATGANPVAETPEPQYPCAECGTLRTKAEGGTTFTVCDACWEKKYPTRETPLAEGRCVAWVWDTDMARPGLSWANPMLPNARRVVVEFVDPIDRPVAETGALDAHWGVLRKVDVPMERGSPAGWKCRRCRNWILGSVCNCREEEARRREPEGGV